MARFYPFQTTKRHVASRASEGFNKMYGHRASGRAMGGGARHPLGAEHTAARDLGAVFFQTAGWERPFWYESNAASSSATATPSCHEKPSGSPRWWSPVINAEHLAMRESCGPRRSLRLLHFRRHRPARSMPFSTSPSHSSTSAPAKWCIRRSSTPGAGFSADHDHAARRRPFPASSPAAPTAWQTASGSPPTSGERTAQLTDLTSRGRRSGCGAERPANAGGGDGRRRRRRPRELRVCDLPTDRACRHRRPRLAHLLCRRARMGIYVPFEQGARVWSAYTSRDSPTVSWPAGIRCVRHDRQVGEGLSRLRCRSSRRSTTSLKPA